MVLLDSQGLSLLIGRDPSLFALLKGLAQTGETVAVSAATLVEGVDPSSTPAAVRWSLSGLDVVDVTRAVALRATDLLRAARRHGHRDAMDAIVCATAVLAPERTTILTSDPADITSLVAGHRAVTVLAV